MIPHLLFQLSSGAAVDVSVAATADFEPKRGRRAIAVRGNHRSIRLDSQRRRLQVKGR
jgi:hypothetical protein